MNFKINGFEVQYWFLGYSEDQQIKSSIQITDYKYSSNYVLTGYFEFSNIFESDTSKDFSTFNYAKMLHYALEFERQSVNDKPENIKVLDSAWYRKELRYQEFKNLLTKMQVIGKIVDQIYYLSNDAGEDVVDWQNLDIEDNYLVRLRKSNNKLYLDRHLNLNWRTINPFHFEFDSQTPANAIDFLINENMQYQDCLQLGLEAYDKLDQKLCKLPS